MAGLSVMLSNCLAHRKDCLLYLNMFINHAFQTPSAQERATNGGPEKGDFEREPITGAYSRTRLSLMILQGG